MASLYSIFCEEDTAMKFGLLFSLIFLLLSLPAYGELSRAQDEKIEAQQEQIEILIKEIETLKQH